MIFDQVFFGLCAICTLAGALMTVLARRPIRSAMALLLAIIGTTGLFVSLHAQFLAAVELIVYAGAVVVLFVFVIMLIGADATPPNDGRGRLSRWVGGVALGLAGVVTALLLARTLSLRVFPPAHPELGTIDAFGRELFSRGLVPFEIAAALFVVAIVGALAVGRGKGEAS
jgi:NADH-quinone oxidoreductase subunit J